MGFKKYLSIFSVLMALNSGCTANNKNYSSKKNVKLNNISCDMLKIKQGGYNFKACREDLDLKVKKYMNFITEIKDHGKKYGLDDENYLFYRPNHRLNNYVLYSLWVAPNFFLPEDFTYKFYRINTDGNHVKKFNENVLFYQSKVDKLDDEKKNYNKLGYDTYRRASKNYAGSSNPDLTDSLMGYSFYRFVEVVFHESWHANVYSKKKRLRDLSIEEAMATKIGFLLAEDFFKSRGDHNNVRLINLRKKSTMEKSLKIKKLYDSLNELYNSDLSPKKKEYFKNYYFNAKNMDSNNARLLSFANYHYYYPLIQKVYKETVSLNEFINIMHNTPYKQEDAVKYLESYIGGKK